MANGYDEAMDTSFHFTDWKVKARDVRTDWVDPADDTTRDIRLGQLQLAAANSKKSLQKMPIMSSVIAVTLLYWTGFVWCLTWLVVINIMAPLLRRIITPVAEGKTNPQELRSATLKISGFNLIYMTVFGSITVMSFVGNDTLGQSLSLLVLAATIASTTPITGPSRLFYASDIVPISLYALALPVAQSGVSGLLFSLLVLIFVYLMVDNSTASYRLAEHALTLNLKNEALIASLKKSDRAKSQFLANMSHELRTPLNAILGFSEVMKDEMMGPIGSKVYKSYASDIHGSGQHLLGLVNSILDLAKIEAGKFELYEEVFKFCDVVDDAFVLFRVQAENAGVNLVRGDCNMLTVRWDRRAAKQIILNLMSNALKFTPRGGSISVSNAQYEDGVGVTITDTGCGIAPEYHETIFQSFGQGRHDIASEGTGLGLSICKGLVELHGGRMMLESHVGKGSAFTIVIPYARVVMPDSAAAAA